MYCSSAQGGDFAPIGCIELPIIPDFAWRNGLVCFKRDRGFVHVVGLVFLLLLLLLSCFVLHPFSIQLVHFVPSRYLKSCCLRRPTWPWSGKTSVFFFFHTFDIVLHLWWWLGFLQHVNIISSLSYHAVRSTVHAAGLRVWRGDGSDEILSRLGFNIWVLSCLSNWEHSQIDVWARMMFTTHNSEKFKESFHTSVIDNTPF